MLLSFISAAFLLSEPPPTPPAAHDAPEPTVAAAPQQPVSPPEESQLRMDELNDLRAGDDTHVTAMSDQTLTAVNSGNSVTADQVGSGAVNLSDGAFNGFAGIGNFVVNTGHNNNLQGSISVTIAVTPQ